MNHHSCANVPLRHSVTHSVCNNVHFVVGSQCMCSEWIVFWWCLQRNINTAVPLLTPTHSQLTSDRQEVCNDCTCLSLISANVFHLHRTCIVFENIAPPDGWRMLRDVSVNYLSHLPHHCQALNGLIHANVPLRNYSLTHTWRSRATGKCCHGGWHLTLEDRM